MQLSSIPHFELKELAKMVKSVCRTRDESHGFSHMERVWNYAFCIARDERIIDLKIIEACVLMHDVFDKKYEISLDIKREDIMNVLIASVGAKNMNRVMKIADNVSFSKERDGKKEKMESNVDELILDIVCDSDRLDAIGAQGFHRCITYNKASNISLSHDEIMKLVFKHCDEKLLKLYPNSFKTTKGKEIAGQLHNDLVKELEKYKPIKI